MPRVYSAAISGRRGTEPWLRSAGDPSGGPTDSATTDYPPPQTRTVRTAWFAGGANSA
ncbi:hypothetical protein ACAG26_23170 [Mycobacterium sp. pUA109]|uniref:hypothetical protein n=1 Tax=Mycobacterium sp. pUA109 TaxID=3238982 RepID=UPI00351BA8F0